MSFLLILCNEIVEAKPIEGLNYGRVSHYSFNFDDNAFAIIGGEEESSPTSKIQGACKKNKEKIKNWYPLASDEEIKSKNVFQRSAIYNSLQVKIKKEGTNWCKVEKRVENKLTLTV
ncbi:MAG: hypothetical protein MI921_29260 [Cytophagales bacterium]|nr:hypothetical protein [Cytophagales bacterium]